MSDRRSSAEPHEHKDRQLARDIKALELTAKRAVSEAVRAEGSLGTASLADLNRASTNAAFAVQTAKNASSKAADINRMLDSPEYSNLAPGVKRRIRRSVDSISSAVSRAELAADRTAEALRGARSLQGVDRMAERDSVPGPASTGKSVGSTLVASDVRGLQVGERNYQLNRYSFKIEAPDVDFDSVINGRTVARALDSIDKRPEDPRAIRQLDRVLSRPSGGEVLTEGLPFRSGRFESKSAKNGIFGSLFVHSSSGLLVGDGTRQENFFTYVAAPSIDAARLIATNHNLRMLIIESLLSGVDLASGEISQTLSDSLGRAASHIRAPRRMGLVVHPSWSDVVYVNGVDGVTAGDSVRQRNEVRTIVQAPSRGVAHDWSGLLRKRRK
jgi:hypothetical protein